jgi:hypothetical protein
LAQLRISLYSLGDFGQLNAKTTNHVKEEMYMGRIHVTSRRLIASILAVGFVSSLAATPIVTVSAASSGTQSVQTITKLGTSSFSSAPSALSSDTLKQALPTDSGDDLNTHSGTSGGTVPTTNPNPAPNLVTSNNQGFSGFQGLTHYDTRTRDGGNAFSLEPPDQGLCVGNGYVLEPVNDVLVVFNSSGSRLTTPTSMNTFFGLPYAINRTTGVRGDFLSDPKCLYDGATNRFFLTVLQEDPAPSVRAHTLLAVSNSGDPTGSWTLYSIDATDDGNNGTPSHPNCPCFGDQPLIGADSNGFYISTNEFPSFVAGFNGAQIYAISKTALVSGTATSAVHINAGNIPTPDAGGIWYSVQPATSPSNSNSNGNGNGNSNRNFDTSQGGTEWFLSALQFGPAPLDNRIAAWALTNTKSLNSATPNVTLANTVISSETYGSQPNGSLTATQKAGSIPLGDLLHQPENVLNANDDRMNQVVYAGGLLYSGLNTVVGNSGQTGIAYFIVSPKAIANGSTVRADMVKQGYVAAATDNVLFPSIGVNSSGQGIMTFTLSGPNYFPTSAYTTINANSGAGAIHIAGAGIGPADGFTGYAPFGGSGVERWGDYSASVAAPDGSIWFASEYIAQTCTDAEYAADTTCGGTRTSLANWATFIGHVTF